MAEACLTQRAVDRWVHDAFLSVFAALSCFRFDSDSQPTHLLLTQTVGPPGPSLGTAMSKR